VCFTKAFCTREPPQERIAHARLQGAYDQEFENEGGNGNQSEEKKRKKNAQNLSGNKNRDHL
jgi:hypothetical protein